MLNNSKLRSYIKWNGRWRYVYILNVYHQTRLFGDPVKIAEFKLTKNSQITHSAERSRFRDIRPTK